MIYPRPKIVNGASTIIIYHSYCDPVFNDPQIQEQVSPITGYRNYVLIGDRSHYIIFIHLEKFDNPGTTLTTLRNLHGLTIDEFYIDENNTDPVMNTTGQAEKFVVSQIIPVYLDNTVNYSAVIMRLDNLRYVKAPEPQYRYWQDESGGFIVDEDGNKIIT